MKKTRSQLQGLRVFFRSEDLSQFPGLWWVVFPVAQPRCPATSMLFPPGPPIERGARVVEWMWYCAPASEAVHAYYALWTQLYMAVLQWHKFWFHVERLPVREDRLLGITEYVLYLADRIWTAAVLPPAANEGGGALWEVPTPLTICIQWAGLDSARIELEVEIRAGRRSPQMDPHVLAYSELPLRRIRRSRSHYCYRGRVYLMGSHTTLFVLLHEFAHLFLDLFAQEVFRLRPMSASNWAWSVWQSLGRGQEAYVQLWETLRQKAPPVVRSKDFLSQRVPVGVLLRPSIRRLLLRQSLHRASADQTRQLVYWTSWD